MKEFDYSLDSRFFHPISLKEVIESQVNTRDRKIPYNFGKCCCENHFDYWINYTEDDIRYAIERDPSTKQLTMSLLVQCPECKKWTYIGGIC